MHSASLGYPAIIQYMASDGTVISSPSELLQYIGNRKLASSLSPSMFHFNPDIHFPEDLILSPVHTKMTMPSNMLQSISNKSSIDNVKSCVPSVSNDLNLNDNKNYASSILFQNKEVSNLESMKFKKQELLATQDNTNEDRIKTCTVSSNFIIISSDDDDSNELPALDGSQHLGGSTVGDNIMNDVNSDITTFRPAIDSLNNSADYNLTSFKPLAALHNSHYSVGSTVGEKIVKDVNADMTTFRPAVDKLENSTKYKYLKPLSALDKSQCSAGPTVSEKIINDLNSDLTFSPTTDKYHNSLDYHPSTSKPLACEQLNVPTDRNESVSKISSNHSPVNQNSMNTSDQMLCSTEENDKVPWLGDDIVWKDCKKRKIPGPKPMQRHVLPRRSGK